MKPILRKSFIVQNYKTLNRLIETFFQGTQDDFTIDNLHRFCF